jgi:squalene-hopene/tetraprenyl-beta-curcumene cyclase
MLDTRRLEAAFATARDALLAERNPGGYWVGELSTSALSTATAVAAISLCQRRARKQAADAPVTNVRGSDDMIAGGLRWLAEHQNSDGGWGDTVRSVSNISTTILCRAAFHIANFTAPYKTNLEAAEAYMNERCGAGSKNHAEGIRARYGKDRTFSVPILMTCALAGLVEWEEVPPLPFELACLPQAWFRLLNLPVVSYALPALIAIGQAIDHHRRPRNPLVRGIRALARKRSLRVLERIQPSSGGFLEAVPLTSFVVMALASIGQVDHPVVRKGVEFLRNIVRPDGSWPIDSNLSVWVTTLAINSLAAAGELSKIDKLPELREWLLAQQFKERHPYTGADPGGWGWTHLPGSVPDADDTAGALLALAALGPQVPEPPSVTAGLRWLSALQNTDGGLPTFCRGWGHLPFDRSGADLTAHGLRAWLVWRHSLPVKSAAILMASYLEDVQLPDGSWLPLWFGNQHAPADENPTYGTARVLAAYRDLGWLAAKPAQRGIAWLLSAQNADGSWGGAAGVPGGVEETALALEVLIDAGPQADTAVERGLEWLVAAVEAGRLRTPEPIGFYFAKLWYFERLYPILFTVAALGRIRSQGSVRREH